MTSFVGVDWASNGWVGAELDGDDRLAVGFYPTMWNLWHAFEDVPDRVLVDIPIGLPEDGRRACDEQAKECLDDRRSSVFWTPIREAVYEDNIEDAKDVQENETGSSISNQAWAIVPRIREVDTFLRETEDARGVVRESHPEVCFRALGDDDEASMAGKSSDEGIEARREVLASNAPVSREDRDRAVAVLAEPDYAARAAEDDVLDAIVLAVTAKHVADGEYSILSRESESDEEHPAEDDAGLPMEIVSPEA